MPDALYKTAFQLFDTNGNGTVSFDEFLGILSKTTLHKKIPFNYDCDFIKLYFGKNKDRQITYSEFSQFLHDFHEEYASVAFKAKDKDGSGFISAADFEEIMTSVKSHLLTPAITANLRAAASGGNTGQAVSYAFFIAFISLLSNMELTKKVYLNATDGSRTAEVTKEQFLYSAQMMSQITPLEIDVLFVLCDLLHHTGKVTYSDFQQLAPEQYMKQVSLYRECERLAEDGGAAGHPPPHGNSRRGEARGPVLPHGSARVGLQVRAGLCGRRLRCHCRLPHRLG